MINNKQIVINLFIPGLGTDKREGGVDKPLSAVLILPLVGDLVGAVVSVNIGIVHQTSVESTNTFRDNPLDVVHDGVRHGVGGDVLVVVRLPEGHHTFPQRAIPLVSFKILL